MDNPIYQEAYRALSVLLTHIGIYFDTMGLHNVVEGCNNNATATRELGERQIKAGRYFVILATYLENGTVPDPKFMEYLAAQ